MQKRKRNGIRISDPPLNCFALYYLTCGALDLSSLCSPTHFSLLSISQAYKFSIGGKDGWVVNPSVDYNQWSGRSRFQVSDSLVFKYNKGSNSVLEVTKDDYEKGNKEKSIKKFEDGDTEFQIERSGPYYFISGKDDNCEKGQKLIVVVLAVRSPPPYVPTPPNAPLYSPPNVPNIPKAPPLYVPKPPQTPSPIYTPPGVPTPPKAPSPIYSPPNPPQVPSPVYHPPIVLTPHKAPTPPQAPSPISHPPYSTPTPPKTPSPIYSPPNTPTSPQTSSPSSQPPYVLTPPKTPSPSCQPPHVTTPPKTPSPISQAPYVIAPPKTPFVC
ncbi:PREDICTED: early nodulin-like protein 2 [Lupinus angustifolius]|uniref:early nodulin-like protein 2 n=1 Tax=Lupinus angustifolius TaxID=3871 RepID=UPI00092F5F38|nr:PREDICTED: early nodulin-like protein 2 [Lupinus angustifolius]